MDMKEPFGKEMVFEVVARGADCIAREDTGVGSPVSSFTKYTVSPNPTKAYVCQNQVVNSESKTKLEAEKALNGDKVDDETRKKKKSKKHKKHKRSEEDDEKAHKKKKKAKKEKHKSPKPESETSLSDVEDLIKKSRDRKPVHKESSVESVLVEPEPKPKNGEAKHKAIPKIDKDEALEIISSNSDTENYQEDCASPELNMIEDDLNLEELMKQKELLQARLVAYFSDRSDDSDGGKKDDVICINDDKSPVIKKSRSDDKRKHKSSKDRSSEREKERHRTRRREEDLREIINRENRKEMEKRLEYRERKERERRKQLEVERERERARGTGERTGKGEEEGARAGERAGAEGEGQEG
ncbi:hypothetical protein MSG28_001206 [Choristoneura fumiferana]|uniref:Uncharacterized protein n=1 Tax=Choristoneura fumiferana TaxID=7141 RepID=A0ACC0K4U4_CHOFU|nr:hypothetical protein MSG28_001206 [Choristoneura fumiferana]